MHRRIPLNTLWPQISESLQPFITGERESLSIKDWMTIYQKVYTFFLAPDGEENNDFEMLKQFYARLKALLLQCIERIFSKFENELGNQLLSSYKKQYVRYTFIMNAIQHMFKSFNHEVEEKKQLHLLKVYDLALVAWKEKIFLQIKDNLMASVLTAVESERNGEFIDPSYISALADSFVELSEPRLNQENPNEASIYTTLYQKEFFDAAERYYTSESATFMANTNNDVCSYMKKAEERLRFEDEKSKIYLRKDSIEKFIHLIERVLVSQHKEVIASEFERLIEEKKMEDLTRMYNLFSRTSDGVSVLKAKLAGYFKKVATQQINAVASTVAKDPKPYIETLITLYKSFVQLVDGPFNSDAQFHAELFKTSKQIINNNAVTKQFKSVPKSAELLAKYSNVVLKKGFRTASGSEEEIDQLLTDIILIFTLLEDKDVFISIYGKALALRFIHQVYASEDLEHSMITKLKASAGVESVLKLQRMFTDFTQSRDSAQEFNTYIKEIYPQIKVDCDVRVLSFSAWPLPAPSATFLLPPILLECVNIFEKYYTDKHKGRKVTWLHQFSKVELTAAFTSNKKRYVFQCFDNYLAAILLLFNDATEVTVEDMSVATKLESNLLYPAIATLAKQGIIGSESFEKTAASSTLQSSYKFKLLPSYKSQKIKVPIKTESEKAAAGAAKPGAPGGAKENEWEEDRKIKIQAAIVRVMKTRKELQHAQLIAEVIQQLKVLFEPQIPIMKKCINILIEKEYLARVEGKHDTYQYLA